MLDRKQLAQLRAAAGALRHAPSLLWQADSRLTAWLSGLAILLSIIPLAQLWLAKLIIDRLVVALRLPHPGDASHPILWLAAAQFLVAVLGLVSREAVSYQRQLLAERLTRYVSERILVHTQELDLELLEQPEYYDHLQRAEETAFYRPAGLLGQLVTVLQALVALSIALLLLARLEPLALPLLILATVPFALVQSSTASAFHALWMGQTPESRQARYLSQLLSTDTGAKEIRVLRLGAFLIARYRSILLRHEQQLARLLLGRSVRSALTGVLPTAAYAGVFAYLCLQALSGAITVGDLTLYIGLIWRSQDALEQLVTSLSKLVESTLFLENYQAFLALQPSMNSISGNEEPADLIREGISFEDVSYQYAGASEPALTSVSLHVRAGETVAIVGESGAGKTTLVKLLSRLYDPESGSIKVDGTDIREFDQKAWQAKIAVVFQDFLRYSVTAAENIGFGQLDVFDDRARVVAAAESSGASTVIGRLPQQYETVLGSSFEEGAQLSGGEWQMIALARALIRDAAIVVLDEPTAALDARAEYEVFRHLRALTRDRIVFLISHRFSTVRAADRIYVLQGGTVVESGTHEELLDRRGLYAELFHLQAAGYR